MRPILTVLITIILTLPLGAQESTVTPEADDAAAAALTPLERWQADPSTVFDAAEVDLNDFLWLARPVVVFSDAAAVPAFQEQLLLLSDRPQDLRRRDVVVITDTSPATPSDIRLALRPRGFALVLIAKDGTVNLRKPFPWDAREISHAIDKWPIRQQEIRDNARGG